MKPARGELISQNVILSKTNDIGRLFHKSKLGIILSNNCLQLSLIESTFLIEEKKLNVYHKNKKINFEEMLSYAAALDSSFEEKYVVFQDLRTRGIQVRPSQNSMFTFFFEKKNEETLIIKNYYIVAISEREITSIFRLRNLIDQATNNNGIIWLAIVDEEGDITYYSLDLEVLCGNNKRHDYKQVKGILLSNRVVIFDKKIAELLYKQEFFGKPFAEGLQISFVEAVYLMKQHFLACTLPNKNKKLSMKAFINYVSKNQQDISLRYKVFSDLKEKGLIVKTGFKFGTHLRAYLRSPFSSHAEYLVHTIDQKYETQWSEISRAVRLAHAVNKIVIFALIENESKNPIYLSISRIRP
jgi:tRNA-intron endonuclease